MKALRFFLILFMLTFATAIHAESISINPVTFITGQRTVAIPINCEFTSENITLYQFDLYLPDGVTLAKNADDSYESGITYELSERHKNHTATLKDKSGFVRCVVLNNTNSTIYPGSGLLLTLYVQADADISGDLQCSIKNFMMFESDETKHSMSDTSFAIINLDMLSGKTFTLHCARGYVCGVTQLEGTPFAKYASEFAIVEYNNQTYLYNAGQKEFVVHTNAAQAGLTDNKMLQSKDDFSNIVTGLKWGETGIASYPYYLEDSFGNWMNMESGYVFMNTWKDFEDGNGGNTYAVTIVDADFDDSEAIAMLDAYFNPPATVTYVISDKNGIVFTSEPLPTKPGVVITELPSKLKRDYCNYTLTESTITTGANTVKVNVYYSLPFKLSTSFENAVWYYATIRGSKYLRADENAKDDSGRYMTSSTNRKTASYRWAFFGNPYTCFYIANMGAGEGKYLYASDVPTMQTIENPTATEAALWVPSANSNGFSLRSITGANLYLNDNGQTGNLGFWDSSNAANDVGSRWNIEEIINATGISLNQTSATLTTIGQTLQLTATVTPSNAADKSVTWTSSNTSVATVSSTGLVTAVANGTATITAKTTDGSNKTATCTVTVNIPIPATGISLNQTSATLTTQGQTLQLSATVTPSNATDKSVTWTSSNTSVATVSSTGLVTAVSNGSATITAKTADGSNKTATCEITVLLQLSYIFDYSSRTASVSGLISSNTEDIVIPATVMYNGVNFSVTSIEAKAFKNCSNLRSITIPNSVTNIGNYAFDGCSSLTSVTIPNSVTSIGHCAFRDCGLTTVHISDLAAWCRINFESSESNPVYYAHKLYLNDNEIQNLVIPESVTSIGNSAFSGCSNLTSVTIPNSVTSIGNCAFMICSNLTSVTIPNSVTSIGDNAFKYCRGLTSVNISESVTSIGYGAFWDCSSLKSIIIPEGVTSIGSSTFSGCTSLTSVTIPNSVTSIGDNAFSGCSELTEVYCLSAQVPSTGRYTFEDFNLSSATLYVPASSIDAYKSADQWKDFGTILPIEHTKPYKPFSTTTAYYLYNEEAGMYLCPGNSWDTQASVGEAGMDLLLEDATGENEVFFIGDTQCAAYAVNTRIYNTGNYLSVVEDGVSAFFDQPWATWYFVPQEDGTFLLSSNTTGNYLYYDGLHTALAITSDAAEKGARWRVMTREDIISKMETATADNPVNASSLIAYADFSRNGQQRLGVWRGNPTRGGNNSNFCAEKFDCEFDVYQILTGLPNGVYKVKVQAFYREGADQNYKPTPAVELRRSGNEHLYAKLYANNKETSVQSIFDEVDKCMLGYQTELGLVPQNMSHAATAFLDGLYWNELEVNVTNGILQLGIKKDEYVFYDWTCFDSFRLYYYGQDKNTGDANGNGEVEIGDVTSVLTLMATPEATGYNKKAADANGNGEIEIGDVTTILTIMANGE